MTDMTLAQNCERYLAFLENLTPESLDQLGDFVTSDIRFTDPFNTALGIEAYRRVLEDMFRRISTPHFQIRNKALSGRHCYLHWTFSGSAPFLGNKWEFTGMSLILFSDSGLVRSHEDYWDSGRSVFAALPILGPVVRLLSRRLSAAQVP